MQARGPSRPRGNRTKKEKKEQKAAGRRVLSPLWAAVFLGRETPLASEASPGRGSSASHVLLSSVLGNQAEHRILALTAEGQKCLQIATAGHRLAAVQGGQLKALGGPVSGTGAPGSSALGSGSRALCAGRSRCSPGFLGETPGSLKHRNHWGCSAVSWPEAGALTSAPQSVWRREGAGEEERGGKRGEGEGPPLTTHQPPLNWLCMFPSERRGHTYLAGGCRTRNHSEAPDRHQALHQGSPASPLHKDHVLPLSRPCPPLLCLLTL